MRRTIINTGHAKSQRLMVRGGLLVAAVLVVGGLAGLAERARASNEGTFQPGMTPSESRAMWDSLGTLKRQLALRDLEIARADAVMNYSSMYQIPADLSAAIYDIALAEGINPAIGFRLVQIESGFDPKAKSRVGAIGYTQLMPATARFYMPRIDEALLYDRDVNLRVGFRFLHQLMNRFDDNLHYALLAYNRGPTTVREILAQGGNPANGYAERVVGK
ncbi:MAG: transglycosylase SLT domain-containing protein [Gemmatimonadales bacterium]